jgi:hypothetical protein
MSIESQNTSLLSTPRVCGSGPFARGAAEAGGGACPERTPACAGLDLVCGNAVTGIAVAVVSPAGRLAPDDAGAPVGSEAAALTAGALSVRKAEADGACDAGDGGAVAGRAISVLAATPTARRRRTDTPARIFTAARPARRAPLAGVRT